MFTGNFAKCLLSLLFFFFFNWSLCLLHVFKYFLLLSGLFSNSLLVFLDKHMFLILMHSNLSIFPLLFSAFACMCPV